MEIDISERIEIGENDMGYRFAVGKMPDGRWIGFADSDVGAFIFPAVSDGVYQGIFDRDTAIKLTGAIAQTCHHGYGGIKKWHVDNSLRATPTEFWCKECGDVHLPDQCEE